MIVSGMVVVVDEVAILVVTIVATVFPVRMTRWVLMLVDAAGVDAKRL